MNEFKIETIGGIRCVAIDTAEVGGNGEACDKCCFGKFCSDASAAEDFPCYVAEEEREYLTDICFRLATPVEIFEFDEKNNTTFKKNGREYE